MTASPAPTARTIALLNQKGGVGKTTTTVNLAAALAREGRRVLLLDLDPQAHATLHFGVGPDAIRATIYDLLHSPEEDARQAVIEARERLWLIPSETDLAAAEVELASEADRHHRLSRILTRFAGEVDVILIDCPPSLGMLTISALAAADEVVIPMQAHFLSLQGVGKLFETINLITESINPRLTVMGVVLCMFDSQATHTQEVVADIEAFFAAARDQPVPWRDARLLRPPIRRNIKLAECPSFGQTIFDYAPTAPGAEDYTSLARSLLAVWAEPAPQPTIEVISTAGTRAIAD